MSEKAEKKKAKRDAKREERREKKTAIGLDINSGKPNLPEVLGIWYVMPSSYLLLNLPERKF